MYSKLLHTVWIQSYVMKSSWMDLTWDQIQRLPQIDSLSTCYIWIDKFRVFDDFKNSKHILLMSNLPYMPYEINLDYWLPE